MRVLLTGASGFLGRHVLASLKEQGIETVILGRNPVPNGGFADFIEADILATRDMSGLIQASGATHLLHLAWYAEHGKYWTSPLNLRWVEATTRLTEEFCKADGKQVVIAGTCAEYDWSHGYCRADSTPLNPATLYGTAKDATRRLTMAVCHQYQVPYAWGRVFLPFGSGESRQRLIPALIDVFSGKRPPFAVNASAYRDFLHATDVAQGFVTLLQSGNTGAGNISSGQPVQIEHLVRELAHLLDADPQIVLDLATERPGEPAMLVGENLRLKSLGWRPSLTLTQGLEQSVREALS